MIRRITICVPLGALVVVLACGCGATSEEPSSSQPEASHRQQESPVKRDPSVTREGASAKRDQFVHALDAVLKEAAKHHSLESRQFEVSIGENSDGWFVCITFLPPTPGDQLAGRVTRDGEVVVTPLY